MKDRTPKYRGRVKLLPVAGQKNIYDMTRADEPDDTGTPFNKRTMLQDSTAKFLQLNVANPFVDDALRQMPDRINPIGTIRTTPQESLGAAWLKCDGSRVTFADYPELCKMLRGVATNTEWNSAQYSTETETSNAKKPAYFAGRWIVPAYTENGIALLSTESINKGWEIEKTYNKPSGADDIMIEEFAQNDSFYVLLIQWYSRKSSLDEYHVDAVVKNKKENSWEVISDIVESNPMSSPHEMSIAASDEEFAVYFSRSGNHTISHTRTPSIKSSWESERITISWDNFLQFNARVEISYAKDNWILVAAAKPIGATNNVIELARCHKNADFMFSDKKNISANKLVGEASSVSKIAEMNGICYMIIANYKSGSKASIAVFWSEDINTWDYREISKETESTAYADVSTNGKLLIMLAAEKAWISATPSTVQDEITLPIKNGLSGCTMNENMAVIGASVAVMYHDYGVETRLLPNISLSNDTTTFIKAKQEIDVFEAAENGGDAS